MNLNDPVDLATIAVLAIALVGLAGGAVFATLKRRRRETGTTVGAGTVLARAVSYGGLAVFVIVAARAGTAGIAVMVLAIGLLGIVEWCRLFDLPIHHRISMLIADAVLVTAIAIAGIDSADWLVGGLVLVGASWPVIRADTGRAVHDLGMAAVGFLVVPVLITHGLAMSVDFGGPGIALFAALAVACAGSDVGAFIVGRSIGGAKLAPAISPNKTRAGVAGNVIGAAIALVPFLPALVPWYGVGFVGALVPIVAAGSLWGDLLESAVKREAGVKDAGSWLPGFGGILDRVDSLLITVALAYWAVRVVEYV